MNAPDDGPLLVTMTADQHDARVRAVVEQVLVDFKPEGPPEVLTPKEACAFLRCSPATLLRRRKGPQRLPHHIVGDQVRYSRRELLEWLEAQGTRDEIEGAA